MKRCLFRRHLRTLFSGNGDSMKKSVAKLCTLMCGLCLLPACGSNSAREPAETVRPAAVRVRTAWKGEIATMIEATGTIFPNRETFIGPRVSGRIEAFFVDEGDFVEKGSPLMRLEQIRFKLALDEARAAYSESSANLKNLELKFRRNKVLFEKGVLDKDMFDDVSTQVELARAQTAMARSRFERAEEDMKDSVLNAPFSGFVVERRLNTGETFSGISGEYAFHIVDTGTVKVEVNIFETKKRYVPLGKQVTVSVDAIPGTPFGGAISVVNPLVDAASRKFLVKIVIPNPDFVLQSGMFARVKIPAERRADTVLVPAGAVAERQDKKVVFLAQSGRAAEKAVSLGLVTYDIVEILEGVREGDPVIVDGLYAVKHNTPILVKE